MTYFNFAEGRQLAASLSYCQELFQPQRNTFFLVGGWKLQGLGILYSLNARIFFQRH